MNFIYVQLSAHGMGDGVLTNNIPRYGMRLGRDLPRRAGLPVDTSGGDEPVKAEHIEDQGHVAGELAGADRVRSRPGVFAAGQSWTIDTMNRCNCLPPLDDWADGKPYAWDYEAVLKDIGVSVDWCVELIDGNGNRHRAGEFAGWGLCWKHGAIHIGQTSETIARKATALFVSLWLRGVSASFCDQIMAGMIWFWQLQESIPLGQLRQRRST